MSVFTCSSVHGSVCCRLEAVSIDTAPVSVRSEGERVGREIAGYASLSHAAMTAMKVIGDSLINWKNPPNKSDD